MHLTDAEFAALTHGELAPFTGAAAAHAGDCSECAARLRALVDEDREVGELLRRLDHPAPAIGAESLLRRVSSPPRRRRLSAYAAGIAATLVVAMVAAAAVPRSPVRAFLGRTARTLSGTTGGRSPSRQPPPSSTPQERDRGVAFVPERQLEVTFRRWQDSGEVHISFSGDSRVSLRSTNSRTAFSVAEDRIDVDNSHTAPSYELTIPHALRSVRVRVGSDLVFRREQGRVSGVASRDSSGGYTIRFSHTRRPAP